MPKTKISEFSATPANNTDIDSINIAEGCAPSGINDAIRELMAQLKDFQVGSAGDPVTVGGVLTVTAGAVGTPAITTAGDTNTGIFFPAADTIAFAEGGAEAMRIDSAGNVGIGVTASASYKLDVAGSAIRVAASGLAEFVAQSSGGGGTWEFGATAAGNGTIYSAQAKDLIFSNNSAETARLTSNGSLVIGTTSATEKLHVAGALRVTGAQTTAGTGVYLDYGSGIGSVAVYGPDASTQGIWRVYTATSNGGTGSEKARIDSSGRLLVGASIFGNGCTTTTANLPSNAGVNSINNGSTVAFNFGIPTTTTNSNLGNFFNGNGAVGSITVNGSATSYNTSSDYRLKNITGPITGAKDFILALKPKQGTWKVDGSAFVGFLAHEFQEVSPLSVSGEKDAVDADGKPIMQTMQASSSEVIANIVSLLQEQQALITQLQADVAALKA